MIGGCGFLSAEPDPSVFSLFSSRELIEPREADHWLRKWSQTSPRYNYTIKMVKQFEETLGELQKDRRPARKVHERCQRLFSISRPAYRMSPWDNFYWGGAVLWKFRYKLLFGTLDFRKSLWTTSDFTFCIGKLVTEYARERKETKKTLRIIRQLLDTFFVWD